ncbi:hypothetical protein DSO57_1016806 [Entomophthora muscae]|uniref:Uncharacterized protein n=1 Tax=Entomophthora muscae TaxID=34485 RepID=A0ACC2SU71_9FUNG|nr:hypothetical protein DSO57_1016806 [Entomophthora muscae]
MASALLAATPEPGIKERVNQSGEPFICGPRSFLWMAASTAPTQSHLAVSSQPCYLEHLPLSLDPHLLNTWGVWQGSTITAQAGSMLRTE